MHRFAPRALLLDMDGLMIDSEPLWFRVERAYARAHGADWTAAQAAANVGRGIPATLATMQATLGIAVDDPARDAEAIIDAFARQVGELELKRGCAELLAAARGRVKLALASSSPRRLVDAVVARFALGDVLDAVVPGDAVARTKPAPDIFLAAASRVGVAPQGCVVLEDSLAGATAGRAAGMHVIAVPEGAREGRGFEAVADAVVGDLGEALALLDLGRARGAGA
jgi:sugar-phosphatase